MDAEEFITVRKMIVMIKVKLSHCYSSTVSQQQEQLLVAIGKNEGLSTSVDVRKT